MTTETPTVVPVKRAFFYLTPEFTRHPIELIEEVPAQFFRVHCLDTGKIVTIHRSDIKESL